MSGRHPQWRPPQGRSGSQGQGRAITPPGHEVHPDSLFPQESEANFGATETLSLDVWASQRDDDDYMRSGAVNPNDVLPPMGDLHNLSLYNVADTVCTTEEYHLEPLDSFSSVISSLSPYYEDESRPSQHTATGESTSIALVNPSLQFSDASGMYSSCPTEPILYPPSHEPIAGPSGYQSYAAAGSAVPGPSGSQSYLPAGQPPSGAVSGSQSRSDSDGASASSGAKPKAPYTHRHQRIYGLDEEEKKKRNRELNNEASRIYREKKRKEKKESEVKAREMEDQHQAKQRDLLKQQKDLLKKNLKLLKRALDEATDPAAKELLLQKIAMIKSALEKSHNPGN